MEKKQEKNFTNFSENDFGITEYLNTKKGFSCVLKHRYSDFIVNEIDINGKIVWLKDSNNNNNIINNNNNENLTEESISNLLSTTFKPFLKTEEDHNKLFKFLINYIHKIHIINDKITLNYIEDKNTRKIFHEKIRLHFPFLESETTLNSSTKKQEINIFYISNKNYYKRRKIFPDNKKNILYFSLMKKNIETVTAISYLSKMLHRSNKTLKFCGNKDKRGITTQKVSAFNTLPNEIEKVVNSKNWNKNILIGNYEFNEKELKLGMLKGNQFSVVLRFVDKNIESDFKEIVNEINKNGFINYFGMQRFGVSNVSTNEIGKFVIKKNFKMAFLNILNTDCVKDALKQIKKENIFDLFDDENHMNFVNDIIKIIPNYSIEFKLLNNYKKSGKNSFQSSFNSLNKQLQVLYPHAYQSYIWNLCVSERIKKYGKKLILGDIVKKHDSLYKEINQEDDENNEENDNENNLNENNENNLNENEKFFNDNFEYINESNITKYEFCDLVIPIVGYQVHYPKNDIKNFIEELLKKDEITLNDFKYNNNNKNFNSPGYFRKVIEKPLNNITYEFLHHDEADEDLQNPFYNIEEHPHPKGNKFTSIRIIFQLPQSTYATMLFREISKNSSAGNFQANLSKNIKNNLI
jgi:tRNA pseudouridine13 synthase